jgi:hypothetical protein
MKSKQFFSGRQENDPVKVKKKLIMRAGIQNYKA